MSDIYDDFWTAAIESGGVPENAFFARSCYFGKNEDESIDEVQRLVHNEKTAVSHCISYYLKNRIPLPKVGDYTMVTDFIGNPGCVLETVDVTLAPIPEIPAELAKAEMPEGSCEEWAQWRQNENKDLAKRFKFPYTEDLAVLVETVRVAFPSISTENT